MSSDLVTIATFSNAAAAHVAKGSLETAGIPVFLADEEMVTAVVIYGPALGYIKLQVRESDASDAIRIIANTLPPHKHHFHCPHCHSATVRRTGFLFFNRGWTCDHCRASWREWPKPKPRKHHSKRSHHHRRRWCSEFSGRAERRTNLVCLSNAERCAR